MANRCIIVAQRNATRLTDDEREMLISVLGGVF
jgi:hypothetical protein